MGQFSDVFVACFGSIFGPISRVSRHIFGPILDLFRACLVQFWTYFTRVLGPFLKLFHACFGPFLDLFHAYFGSNHGPVSRVFCVEYKRGIIIKGPFFDKNGPKFLDSDNIFFKLSHAIWSNFSHFSSVLLIQFWPCFTQVLGPILDLFMHVLVQLWTFSCVFQVQFLDLFHVCFKSKCFRSRFGSFHVYYKIPFWTVSHTCLLWPLWTYHACFKLTFHMSIFFACSRVNFNCFRERLFIIS